MKNVKILLCLFLIALALKVSAQSDNTVFSIKDCIDYALTNNSNIKNSRTDEDIAKQQNNQVMGRGLPQATINATWQNNLKLQQLILPPAALAAFSGGKADTSKSAGRGSNSSPAKGGIPLGYKYNSSVTSEVTQMIFDPSFWVGLKAAKYNRIYSAQNVQLMKEQTFYSIANAYYQVIVVQKQVRLLQSNLNSNNKLLSNTELQFKNGVAKQVDVNRIKVTTNNLNSQLNQAKLNLDQSINNLKFQMGMPLEKSFQLSDTVLTFNESAGNTNDTSSHYYENRYNYKIAQTNITLQNLDKRNNIAGYYPTLTGFANYAYIAQGPELGLFKTPGSQWVNYTTASFGLRFRLTIFDGLQRNALIQQSKLKARKSEEALNLTKQNISLEVENARSKYNSTVERIGADQQNVKLAEEVFKVTQLEFREGVGSSSDVVNSETSLRQAQNTYINTLLDLYKARLDMERAKGNLIIYLTTNNK